MSTEKTTTGGGGTILLIVVAALAVIGVVVYFGFFNKEQKDTPKVAPANTVKPRGEAETIADLPADLQGKRYKNWLSWAVRDPENLALFKAGMKKNNTSLEAEAAASYVWMYNYGTLGL